MINSKILFFGNSIGAIRALNVLLNNKDIVSEILVVAPPGGKFHYWHESLKEFCFRMKIECVCPLNVNNKKVISRFRKFNPDVIFSVYYTQILSNEILNLAKYSINFHPSLLPKYRGTAPLIWAIVNGERETGITAHEMTSEIDKGRICGQKKISILLDDTGYSLYDKAAKATEELFDEIFNKVINNSLSFKQQKGRSSYYSNKTPRVNELNPKIQTKKKIYNIVRALAKPLPRSYLIVDTNKYFINKVSFDIEKNLFEKIKKEGVQLDNGLFKFKGKLYIKTKNSFLKIEEYELEK